MLGFLIGYATGNLLSALSLYVIPDVPPDPDGLYKEVKPKQPIKRPKSKDPLELDGERWIWVK